jgi:hypothetical protein
MIENGIGSLYSSPKGSYNCNVFPARSPKKVAMTSILQEAFEKAAALPIEQQQAFTSLVLEEIASEQRWQASLARSQDALAKLADEALAEDAEGRTVDLDDSL